MNSSICISGSRLLFWLQASSSEFRVSGYCSGVVHRFSMSDPRTRRAVLSTSILTKLACRAMSENHRDVLEVDVLFVGGGPGSLAGAIRLAQLLEEREKTGKAMGEVTIAVIEKAADFGFHSCSGAVLDPRAIRELIPDYREKGCPIEADVVHDEVWYLHEYDRGKMPFVPKPMKNEGNHVISLGRLVKWMAGLAEASGRVNLFPATPGAELLYDGEKVVGVRTGDKGVDRNGEKKGNYEPGIDIRAKLTVLGE